MRRFGVLFCLAALMGLGASQASAQQAMEDVIYLKDGSILRGTIIEQIPGKSLKIQMRDGNVFVYDIDKVERMTREPTVGGQKLAVHRKSPVVACALSLFIPGAGQAYNDEWGKGAIHFVVGGVLAFPVGLAASYGGPGGAANILVGVGALIVLGVRVWSIIDAPISANRINKQAQFAHLFQMDAGRFVIGADPVVRRNGVGGALTIHF